VAVDCTALPEALTDRLLLEGAGDASNEALFHSCGLLHKACHGTLFLDAVSELSPPVQAILLHVLQERHCQPDGDSLGIGSNFRVVASSRYDLRERTASGRFHRDLLRCLEERRIDVPALRQRIEDIPALAVWHVGRLCHRLEVPVKALTPEFIDILCRYSWPGNVRELVNVLKQSLLMAHGENTLFAKHLPQHIRIQVARSSLACRTMGLEAPWHLSPGRIPSLQDFRINICNLAEKRYLAHLVQQSGSDTAIACQLTGLSRSRLYALLKKHNITLH
jgi:two-component system NtrC family response regulator